MNRFITENTESAEGRRVWKEDRVDPKCEDSFLGAVTLAH